MKTMARPESTASRASLGHQFFNANEENKNQFEEYYGTSEAAEVEPPSEAQFVLLCLDYLRSLHRSRSVSRDDLEIELGIKQEYLTLAIWALSNSFTRPTELLHGNIKDVDKCLGKPLEFGNDPFFQPEYAHLAHVNTFKNKSFRLSENVVVPSLAMMENEILYKSNPKSKGESPNGQGESGNDFEDVTPSAASSLNPHRSTWYEYEDEHYSNQHRFYEVMGLSSKAPLTLPQIAMSGIAQLRAKSRLQAEENMMSDKLFTNFVDAVSKNGFFRITEQEILSHPDGKVGMSDDDIISISDNIHEERFRKVITKFRTKLAAKHVEDEQMELEEELEEEEEEEEEPVVHSRLSPPQTKEAFRTITEEEHMVEDGYNENHEEEEEEEEDAKEEEEGQDDDDATLVASSVYGDIVSSGTEAVGSNGGEINDEENSKASKRSRQSQLSNGSSIDKKNLESAERLKAQGNASMQKKKYEKAKNYYTKALELIPAGPTSHIYFSNRAAALLSMRNFNEAVWDAERSIALKPDYAKAHARLGLAHFLLEHYEDAVNAYTLAVEYDPENSTNVSYLEKSKRKLALATKEIEEAEEYIATTQRKMKKEPSPQNIVMQSEGDYTHKPDANSDRFNDRPKSRDNADNNRLSDRPKSRGTNKTSNRRPKRDYSHKTLEPSDSSKGDPPGERGLSPPKTSVSLRTRLEKVKKTSPQPIRVPIRPNTSQRKQLMLENDEYMGKDPPVLTTGSSDLSSKNSDDQEEADRLKGEGNKAMARKQYEKAVKCYSKSLRLAPAGHNSHVYFSNRAAALCYLERYEEAELDAERSLALNPEYGKAHARLGLSRYFLRDYYGAVEAYEAALVYDPNNAASKSYLDKAMAKIDRRRGSSRGTSRGSSRGVYME